MQTHREEVNSKLSLVGIGQLHDEEAAVEHELRWQIAVIEAFVWHRRIPEGVQFGVAGVFKDFPRKLRRSSAEAPWKLRGSSCGIKFEAICSCRVWSSETANSRGREMNAN